MEVSDEEREKLSRRVSGQKERRENAVVDMLVAFGKDLKGLQTLPLCVCSRHWMVWFLWLVFFFFSLLRMARH